MKWITRERPKIDRIACPWLIKRFIDPKAEIIYAPQNQVLSLAERSSAIPFDIPDVEYTHYDDKCTFDHFIKKHQLKDEALDRIAAIVRGADTDRHDFAPQAAGLEAIFAGLAYNITDDHQLLDLGMVIYDGLYSWAQHLYKLKHTQGGPAEQMLLQVYHQYLKKKKGKKAPAWARALKEMIQDQLDTNMTLSLQQASEELEINPAYLSREFSKHFDNLTFGEYMRKARIDKAIQLMEEGSYTMTDISYLTGFSDQSHFNRTFKRLTGCSPLAYKKSILQGKKDTK
jgi:hypothetical protein